MFVSVIAAMGANGVIGDDKGLPWHLPADLKRFRSLTWGKPVIMGRRTADLIGKPLPGRLNIVLTRNRKYPSAEGRVVVHSLDEALAAARDHLDRSGNDEVMVIGGGKVYREFIRICNRVYLTIVRGRFVGTVYFPVRFLRRFLQRPEWRVYNWELVEADEKNRHPHLYYFMDRGKEDALTSPPAIGQEEDSVPATVLLEILDFWKEEAARSPADSPRDPRPASKDRLR